MNFRYLTSASSHPVQVIPCLTWLGAVASVRGSRHSEAMPNAAQAPASRLTDRTFYVFTGVVSAAALGLLAWLLLIRRGGAAGVDLRFMPAVNASLNALAACLL